MDPSLVLCLIARLPDTSMFRALLMGGEQFYQWGLDRYLAADRFDATLLVASAAGNWAKKPPKFDPYPRPRKREKDKPKKAPSVKDLFGQMMAHMTGTKNADD